MLELEVDVEVLGNISCDGCGLYDDARNFLSIDTKEGDSTLRRFGIDMNDPSDAALIRTSYAGAICPECGNYGSFDFHPDTDRYPL